MLSHDAGGDRASTVEAYRILLPRLREQRRLRLVALPVRDLEPDRHR